MELVGNTFFYDWEIALIVWLQEALGPLGAAIASFLSSFGEELVLVAVTGFVYWCYDKRFGRYVGLNMLMGVVLNPMIKNVFIRRRPYFDHERILCLKPVDSSSDIYDIAAQGYSFPSGHSTDSVTVYGSLARYLKKPWLVVLAIAVPLLVGTSRFILGVHYPTDVLCGWLLGLLVLFGVPWLDRKIKDKRLFYALLLLITLPGFFYCRSEDYFTGFGMLLGFIFGLAFEGRYVRFENTRSPVRCVLRPLGGIVIFFGLNELLKLPFSPAFLDSGTIAALAVRTGRYFIVLFTLIGIYPMLFRVTAKIGKKS